MRYVVVKSEVEVKVRDYDNEKDAIWSLQAPYNDGNEPKELESFDNLDEAKKHLHEKYTDSATYMGSAIPYYLVTEHYIEEREYDEELEEWVSTGDYDR